MWLVYKYEFPNGKVYIGRSKNWKSRAKAGYGDTVVGKAIAECGWDNVKKEILSEVDTVDEADILEKKYISEYNSTNPEFGYNMTKGCTGGGAVRRYRKPMSDETKQLIGSKNRQHMLGRKRPQKVCEKLSNSLKGHTVSDATREKLRIANTGKHHSDETKQKLSIISRNMSAESRNKIRESLLLTAKERAEKRKKTMSEKYPDGFKQSAESNVERSKKLKGVPKSEKTKQRMCKPKSPEHIAHMREARKLLREAKEHNMTYKEYKEYLSKMTNK